MADCGSRSATGGVASARASAVMTAPRDALTPGLSGPRTPTDSLLPPRLMGVKTATRAPGQSVAPAVQQPDVVIHSQLIRHGQQQQVRGLDCLVRGQLLCQHVGLADVAPAEAGHEAFRGPPTWSPHDDPWACGPGAAPPRRIRAGRQAGRRRLRPRSSPDPRAGPGAWAPSRARCGCGHLTPAGLPRRWRRGGRISRPAAIRRGARAVARSR